MFQIECDIKRFNEYMKKESREIQSYFHDEKIYIKGVICKCSYEEFSFF